MYFNDAVEYFNATKMANYDLISNQHEFIKIGGKVYPYDTLGSNLGVLKKLTDKIGIDFDSKSLNITDIGCANGELAVVLSLSGHNVTAIDFTYKHDCAPYVVNQLSLMYKTKINVVDMSVDRYFDLSEICQPSTIPKKYDLSICFGLIYHLKNPIAFLESLSKATKYAVIGTHIMTHTPNIGSRVTDCSMAYLVDSGELNNDPTNYWIFTEKGYHMAIKMAGFKILHSISIANNDLNIGLPDKTSYGIRNFVVVESTN